MITRTEKTVAAVFVLLVALAAIAFFTVEPAYGQKPPSPPGQGECGHGNSQKPCKEDPQPDRGKDCEEHGPKEGGVNEDHCAGTPTTPEETTPEETTPTTTEEEPSTPTPPATPEAPASPESPSPSAPEAPAAPSAEEPTFQEELEEQVEKQAKQNGAGSEAQNAPGSGAAPTSQTPATEALPHTGLSLWWAVALGTGLVASGLALRRRPQ